MFSGDMAWADANIVDETSIASGTLNNEPIVANASRRKNHSSISAGPVQRQSAADTPEAACWEHLSSAHRPPHMLR